MFEHGQRVANEFGNDRIKLAEAMGWKSGRTDTIVVQGRPIAHTRWFDPNGNDHAQCPDPFTDANDDYAVLEWMRGELTGKRSEDKGKRRLWTDFVLHFRDWCMSEYQIGDYARAALKGQEHE